MGAGPGTTRHGALLRLLVFARVGDDFSTDPTPIWISVPGLVIFTALVLAFAGWRAGRMEINYGGD